MAKQTTKRVPVPDDSPITIPAPDIQSANFLIRGMSPYVQNKFSAKARQQMEDDQTRTDKKKRPREPKNFQEQYEQALHVSTEGWYGIPANGIRAAMISACRLVGFAMTQAKLAVFVNANGFDVDDGTPLIQITKGTPQIHKGMVRLATGVADVRWRPMWHPGWEANVTILHDAGMFGRADVANLLMRVGMQVGIGEGRHDSKKSAGMGWGTFTIVGGE